MKKAWTVFKAGILLLLLFIAIFFIVYLINPSYVLEKAEKWFYPQINIEEKYRGTIALENPIVYELIYVISSLTKVCQTNSNLLDKGTTYYHEVNQHFSKYANHEIVQLFDNSLQKNGGQMVFGSLRFLSLDFSLNELNELVHLKTIKANPFLLYLLSLKVVTIDTNLELIEDFAKKTGFYEFYSNHEHYYQALTDNFHGMCDFENIRSWLELKSPQNYNSYRVIFSSLVGGFHNTLSFKDAQNDEEQIFMFVSPPDHGLDSMSAIRRHLTASSYTRIVFTEIDHNYVNPISDKYLDDIDRSMPDYKIWNKGNGYRSSYATFNEYMTWAVFSLYVIDNYPSEFHDSIIKKQADFMEDRRGFHRFKLFNDRLIEEYSKRQQPDLEELYLPMLEWIASESHSQ